MMLSGLQDAMGAVVNLDGFLALEDYFAGFLQSLVGVLTLFIS